MLTFTKQILVKKGDNYVIIIVDNNPQGYGCFVLIFLKDYLYVFFFVGDIYQTKMNHWLSFTIWSTQHLNFSKDLMSNVSIETEKKEIKIIIELTPTLHIIILNWSPLLYSSLKITWKIENLSFYLLNGQH